MAVSECSWQASGLHRLGHYAILDGRTWSKLGEHGEHGEWRCSPVLHESSWGVLRFSNWDVLQFFNSDVLRVSDFLQTIYLRYLQLRKSNIRAGRTWSWVSSGWENVKRNKRKDYSLTSERKFSKKDPPIPGVLWKPYLDFYCMYHTYVFLNKKYENGKQSHPHAFLLSKIPFFSKEGFS